MNTDSINNNSSNSKSGLKNKFFIFSFFIFFFSIIYLIVNFVMMKIEINNYKKEIYSNKKKLSNIQNNNVFIEKNITSVNKELEIIGKYLIPTSKDHNNAILFLSKQKALDKITNITDVKTFLSNLSDIAELNIRNNYENDKKINNLINIFKRKNELLFDINNLIEATLIQSKRDLNLIKGKLKEIYYYSSNYFNFKLIYRLTRDGDKINDFYLQIKNNYKKNIPRLIIIKSKEGLTFGGYFERNFDIFKMNKKEKSFNITLLNDPNAFAFSFSNHRIYENNNKKDKEKIWEGPNINNFYRVGEIIINEDCLINGGYFDDRILNYGKQYISYEISGGQKFFSIEDIEILEVSLEHLDDNFI